MKIDRRTKSELLRVIHRQKLRIARLTALLQERLPFIEAEIDAIQRARIMAEARGALRPLEHLDDEPRYDA